MPSWPGVFQFYMFLSVALSESCCTFASGLSSSSNSFFKSFIHSAFLLCSFLLHILLQNCFASFATDCWFVFAHSPPTWWQNFLPLFWKVLFCLYCLTQSWYLLNLSSFTNIFWFIFSSCIVRHVCTSLLGVFSFPLVTVYFNFLSSFACCCSYFICPSSLILYFFSDY